jgi:hypothetical protein
MPWFILVLNFLEFAACVAGFIYWKKIRHSYWRLFPVYLGVIVLCEVFCEYLLLVVNLGAINNHIYRFFVIPLEFSFLMWLFHEYFKKTVVTLIPTVCIGIYLVSLPVDWLYVGGLHVVFNTFSYCVGTILILLLSVIFFVRFSRSDEILSYKSNTMFWVCTGIMIFYLGSLPFLGIRNTLCAEYKSLCNTLWVFHYAFNCLMYLTFTTAFIWGKPK